MKRTENIDILNAVATDFYRKVLNRKSFFILDDDANQLNLIERYIKRGNFPFKVNFNTFLKTKEMISSIDLNHADLLIIDINLENLNGFELAKFLRELTIVEIPIVFISSNKNYIRDFYRNDIRNSYFLPKPFCQETFEKLVNSFLNPLNENAA